MKSSKNLYIKTYYNRYCKILKKVIIAAKKMAYDNYIKKSCNTLNTTWKIIYKETGTISKRDDTQHLIEKFNGQNVAEQMNEYFISIANSFIHSFYLHSGDPNTGVTTPYVKDHMLRHSAVHVE
jgi:hypothetical protein